MIVPISLQFCFFLSTLLAGFFLGICFDIYRILGGLHVASGVLKYLSDILFWCLSGILIFIFSYYFNYGQIRYYTFIGIFVGMLFYLKSISRFFKLILQRVIIWIYGVIVFAVHIVLMPIKIIAGIIRIIYFYIHRSIKFIFNKMIRSENKV